MKTRKFAFQHPGSQEYRNLSSKAMTQQLKALSNGRTFIVQNNGIKKRSKLLKPKIQLSMHQKMHKRRHHLEEGICTLTILNSIEGGIIIIESS